MKKIKIFPLAFGLLFIWLAVTAAQGAATGITFTTMWEFNTNNGAYPRAAPVFGPDGNLYGTTANGGSNNAGEVYQITTNSRLAVLHSFNTNNISDGAYPYAPVTAGQDGFLYGVTAYGGTNDLGTIFKISTNGVFTELYSFGANGYALNGAVPAAGLIQGSDGNFYGMTYSGGSSNVGTVFQFSTNGVLTTLYSFTGTGSNADGMYPAYAPLVEGPAGVFYGTTTQGGTNDAGTVFQITSGGTYDTLFQFDGTNANEPYGGLCFGPDGNLYGTTFEGGTNDDGNVFKITTNGLFTVVHQFIGTDGASPFDSPIVDSNNNIYGTTIQGGSDGYGTVFELNTNGVLTTLYGFTGGSDGGNTYASVLRDANANLYGATTYAGSQGAGTLFRLRDTTSPTIAITTPTAQQKWSNDVFTVTGTARDNVSVANVFYSLNSSGWSNAVTANNWSNWTAQVTLTPGTNFLHAYAVDGSGNISTTNSVSFVYILSAPLTVLTNGPGTLSPNYNGSLLEIGVDYSMIATAASGFGFVNWADGNGNVLTNSATLKFLMESNLTFTANFVDVTKPTLSITSPTANQHWSNNVFTVTGTAKDNVNVSNVFYSLNGSGWSNAATANNWSNWTAQVTLTPGTNVLQAYTVGAGNLSTTSSVSFVYILSAPLTVLTNGPGILSPNYNGALLQIGVNYSMTATAASGFGFVNWSDGNGSVLTNSATLKFLMESNLTFTAKFVDVTRPTLSITSPTANQHWSNNVFAVTGTAKDNVSVSNVFYSLNSSGWSNAVKLNNWSNWTAQVTLTPGTNVLQAYAVDGSGNLSTTSSVSFVYILSAPLTVLTNGPGILSPNYNGALLQIGVNYSMTATAASGFGFVNWSDGNGSVLTNSATLKFLMESNLTFTAKFVDVTRPTLTVTSPTSLQRWSNEVFAVTGTAKDNVSVSNVFYSLNSSGWSNAVKLNNWSNWTAQVTLTPGTNVLQAYAVDGAGNTSTTNNVIFDFVVTNQLQVLAHGLGSISPNYSNAWLEVGRNYGMTASPASGFVVTNWTIATNQLSGRVTNNATVQFMMVSNLILQVDFADVTRPALTIASPASGQHLTNALAIFAGTAKDNWGCSGVWYQLNSGTWNLAATGNGYTNWSTTNALIKGTNVFMAYAVDFGGNFSTTNSLSVLSSNTFEFQLNFTSSQPLNGNGLTFNLEISPGLNGQIQASTNLLDWITLTNFVGTGTNLLFNDQSATNYDRRFYRAVIP